MNRRDRSIMTCVHRLQHVKRLLAANFTDDNAVGTHTQSVDQELPLMDGALPFDVRGTRFQSHDVRLMELQLSSILDRYDAFTIGQITGEHVEQRCFRSEEHTSELQS